MTRDEGFTLLEVIVTFAIVTLSLVVFFRALGEQSRSMAQVREYDGVMANARSVMESIGADGTLSVGHTTGRFENGRAWSLRIAEMVPSGAATTGGARPFWVVFEAHDNQGAIVLTLTTVKLGRWAS